MKDINLANKIADRITDTTLQDVINNENLLSLIVNGVTTNSSKTKALHVVSIKHVEENRGIEVDSPNFVEVMFEVLEMDTGEQIEMFSKVGTNNQSHNSALLQFNREYGV